jgi:hypothetical protein
VLLLVALWFLLTTPPIAIVFLVLLSLPTAGIFRLAALIARDRPVGLIDSLSAWRQFGRRALAVGAAIALIVVVLAVNTLVGATSLNVVGWAFATAAAWGLVIVASAAFALWPLLLDPLREDQSLRSLMTLAGAVVFSAPLRYALLMALVAIILIASTVAFAALISVSVSFVALLTARYVLPAADRLEGRATKNVELGTD